MRYSSEGILHFTKKGDSPVRDQSPKVFLSFLSTETKLLDDSPVSLDVNLLEVVQKLAPFTYETEKGTTCSNVLLVLLHVLGKVSDTVGE